MKKEQVIARFLEFVATFVPLGRAVMATLGGEGLEARHWLERGIPGENGWLVEKARQKSLKLIKLPYRYCSTLENFRDSFVSSSGPDAGVDGFHLDLCGTFEAGNVSQVFAGILPLVMRSPGRCFAVTVADARENKSVRRYGEIAARLKEQTGTDEYDVLYRTRAKEQQQLNKLREGREGDYEVGVQRELGLASVLVDCLVSCGAYELDQIERYSYLSDTYGSNFPMRTYFFHFSKRGSGRRRLARPSEVLSLWHRSPLYFVTDEGVECVTVSESSATGAPAKTQGFVATTPFPNLERFAAGASRECQAEFALLMSLLKQAAIDAEVSAALRRAGFTHTALTGSRSNTAAKMVEAKPRAEKTINDEVLILGMVDLLLGRAAGQEAYAATMQKLAKQLRFNRRGEDRNVNRRLGGLYARTQGKFRGQFLRRVLSLPQGEQIFPQLVSAYAALTGEQVSPQALRKEAQH